MACLPSSDAFLAASDEHLLSLHLQGQQAAFAELVRRYGPMVLRLMRRAGISAQEADDRMQDVFVLLHRHAASFDPQRTLRPWLLTIAHNVKREHWRRLGRRPEEPLVLDGRLDPSVPPPDLRRRDAQRLLERALKELPAGQRDVVELHWLAGLSMPDVAATIGISLSAVKVRAHRAYKHMRAVLEQEA